MITIIDQRQFKLCVFAFSAFAIAIAIAIAIRVRDNQERVSINSLTDREKQVLKHIASGLSNKMIARKLDITEGTVKVHVKRVLSKLGMRSRVEAAVWMTELKTK